MSAGSTGLTRAQVRAGLHVPVDLANPEDPPHLTVPLHWDATAARTAETQRIVRQRLPGPGWEQRGPGTAAKGRPRRLTWHPAAQPPPAKADLAHQPWLLDEMRKMPAGVVVAGLATGNQLVKVDFGATPHVGFSIGTGGGKTILFRAICAGLRLQGAERIVILDVGSDHGYAIGDGDTFLIDGIEVYEDLEAIEERMRGLWDLMNERRKIRRKRRGTVFPKVYVLIDEGNVLSGKIKAAWDRIPKAQKKGEGTSPPFFTYEHDLLTEGRKHGIHLLGAYQKMSAQGVAGAGSLATTMRGQFMVKFIGRPGAGDWATVVGQGIREPSLPQDIPGRMARVTDQVQLFQALFLTEEQARWIAAGARGEFAASDWDNTAALATAAARVTNRADGPAAGVSAGQGAAKHENSGAGPGSVIQDGNVINLTSRLHDRHIGLREACESGLLPWSLPTAQQYRYREGFPPPVGKSGREHHYSERALREYASGTAKKTGKVKVPRAGRGGGR